MAFYDVYVKKAYTTDRATIRLPSNITGYEFMTRLRQMVPHHLNIANINNMEFVLMGQNMNLDIPAEEGIVFIPQNNELVNNIFGNVTSIGFYIRPIRPNNMNNINNIEYNIMMNNIIHHNNNNMIDNMMDNIMNHHNNIQNNDDDDDYDVNGANANANANDNANANANTRPTESLKCIICLTNSRVIRFDPCGHLICCDTCSRHPSLITCPTCRVRIELRQITYIS
jgi:hypothetical protein